MQIHVVTLMNMPISNTLAPETAVIMAAQQALELAGSVLEVRFAGVKQVTELHLDFVDRDAPVLIPTCQFTLCVDNPGGGTTDGEVIFSMADIATPVSRTDDPTRLKQLIADKVVDEVHGRVLRELREKLSQVSDVQRGLLASIHILEPATTS